jgi:two-component system response regulator AtoC
MADAALAPDSPTPGESRWQSFIRGATEPLFLLNRQRRLLFANAAWECCTGLKLASVRGRSCRRLREPVPDREDAVLALMAPPPEALAGQVCQARRHAAGSSVAWWQLDFFPLQGEQGLLGIVGKITVLKNVPAVLMPLPDRLMALRDRQAAAFRLDALDSQLTAMVRVREQVCLAARERTPVSIVGEPGTGKHWLARAIHQAGPTRDRSFACLHCRELSPVQLGEMLFEPRGRRLSFGTIYLREPAEMQRELQDVLARMLMASDHGPDEPRIIVGHSRDPGEAVRAGRLLDDLHHALTTLTISLPPLRERLADLDGLIGRFSERARILIERKVTGVSVEAMTALRTHAWPGNLRELYDVVRAACFHATGELIEIGDLPFYLRSTPPPAEKNLPLDEVLADTERQLIRQALRQARGNRTRAAETLGIWRARLIRRMESLGIEGDSDGGDNDSGTNASEAQ